MPIIKELDPKAAQEMLEGYEDTLTPMVQAELDFVTSQVCPRCGGGVLPEHLLQRMIRGGPPRPLARCGECECLFDPYSGLLLELGNLGKLEPTIPIIRPAED